MPIDFGADIAVWERNTPLPPTVSLQPEKQAADEGMNMPCTMAVWQALYGLPHRYAC